MLLLITIISYKFIKRLLLEFSTYAHESANSFFRMILTVLILSHFKIIMNSLPSYTTLSTSIDYLCQLSKSTKQIRKNNFTKFAI